MLLRVFAIAAWLGCQAAALVPPSKDPWYVQPANVSAYEPGDVIRSRMVGNELKPYTVGKIKVGGVHQYLYRTSDNQGRPVAAATTLIVPEKPNPEKLVVYEAFYDANNPDCSPSYGLRPGSSFQSEDQHIPSFNQPLDLAFIAACLAQGWWVMVPDYEGLHAQFSDALLSAYTTLDATRVALSEGQKVGLSKSARYVMWGYSGGALAVEWAAELQPSYAPELNFAGASSGGLLPNLTSTIDTINMGPFSGASFVISIGIAKAYPEFHEWLNSSLVENTRDMFFGAANSCVFGEAVAGTIHDFFVFFTQGREAFLHDVPRNILNTVGQAGTSGKPKVPMYYYKGLLDEISPIGDTDQLIDEFCSSSEPMSIYYHRIIAAEHVSAAILGSADALDWLADRLDGKPLENPDSCKTQTTLAMELKPKAIKYFGMEGYSTLVSFIGGSLNPF